MKFLKSNNLSNNLYKTYSLWLEKNGPDGDGEKVNITVKVFSSDKGPDGTTVPIEELANSNVAYAKKGSPKDYLSIGKSEGWNGSTSTTDDKGTIKFSLPKKLGKVIIIAASGGYNKQTKELDLSNQTDDVEITFELVSKTTQTVTTLGRAESKPPPIKKDEIIKPKEERFVGAPTKFLIIDKQMQSLNLRDRQVQDILSPFLETMFDGMDKSQISQIFIGQKCLDMFQKMTRGFRTLDVNFITRKNDTPKTTEVKFINQGGSLLKLDLGSVKLKYPPESELFDEFKGKINLEDKQTLHGLWFWKCFGYVKYNGVSSPQFTSIFANCVDFISPSEDEEGCDCFINFDKFVEIVNEVGLVKKEDLSSFAILDKNPMYKYLKDNLNDFETSDKSDKDNFEITINDCDNGGTLKVKSPFVESIPKSVFILRKIEDPKIQKKILTRDNQREISKELEDLFPNKNHSVRRGNDNDFEITLNFNVPEKQLLKFIEVIKDDY